MSRSATILSGFNNHFEEFIDSIQSVFPNDVDILASKNALKQIRKANPKLIIKIWKEFIVDKYDTEINKGDIRFSIDKDYNQDISGLDSSNKIMDGIDRLRKPIRDMGEKNQAVSMSYIANLSKISKIYYPIN